jgi:hypothetical protein
MLKQRLRTIAAYMPAFVEIKVDAFEPRNDRTDLIRCQRVERPHMRQAHQLISDLPRTGCKQREL